MDLNTGEHMNLKDFFEEADLLQYFVSFRDILKVTKVSQLKFVANDDLVQIGMSKPEQRRYKKIYTKYFPNTYISKIKKFLGSNKKHESNPQNLSETASSIEVQPFSENNVKVPTKHIIPVEDITINKELGMGQFGVVQQGTWTTGNQRVQVAIKCLGHEMTSNSTEFLKEAAVMHSIEHTNIVRLYGVVLHLDSLMLVTELAPLRSLLECLREIPLRTNFPVPTLCLFAEQICDGMTYLENKRLIHRDLAARNILVFNKDKVKISDFGLSRALGVGKDYYQTNYNVNLKLPVAWCAPECILYLRFTSASDVWAFGVCLWEMFTYGFQPWAAFSGQQILENIDAPGFQRLERPECCPDAYYMTMLECWSQEPHSRPKFKDLGPKLREIRPEQVQAVTDCQKLDGRRNNYLDYNKGQIITVLGKENMTNSSLWLGVLPGGACGNFDPNNTKPYIQQRAPSLSFHASASLSPNPTRSSGRLSDALRPSLLRTDAKRHTFTGKRTIQRSMISSPQGDVIHTGHIGLDGAYFGDVSFLDPAVCPPRQVVTPYKPSEDLEQVPLINPNSPSYLTGGASSTPPYPLLPQEVADQQKEASNLPKNENGDGVNCGDSQTKLRLRKSNLKLSTEPTTSKSLLNKVKSATMGRSFRADDGLRPTTSKTDEIHEYHEISDTDMENNLTENATVSNNLKPPDSPNTRKSQTDFSQSLLDEIDSMFRNMDAKERRDENISAVKQRLDSDHRSQTLSKLDKKKPLNTGTMKMMSAHEQKTLDTAVALANEITTRSMHDLGKDTTKPPNSPSDRSKFHFKFPLVSALGHQQSHHAHDVEKDAQGKQERRNFSEEANSVPDVQSILTEESKQAYASLIEQPSSSSLIPHLAKDTAAFCKPKKSQPIPIPRASFSNMNIGLGHQRGRLPRFSGNDEGHTNYRHRAQRAANPINMDEINNDLPLPPRTTKPRLVDKPRHIRKHPLVLSDFGVNNNFSNVTKPVIGEENLKMAAPIEKINIYQNFLHSQHRREGKVERIVKIKSDAPKVQYQNLDLKEKGIDVFDGPSAEATAVDLQSLKKIDTPKETTDTNPFTGATSSSVNPFKFYSEKAGNPPEPEGDTKALLSDIDKFEKGSLLRDTDHVSVEDLLEFADQKPCGRQRGVESDEVRIMCKVLQQEVSPNECLDALEISDWNVHLAIKIMRVRIAVGDNTNLEECFKELTSNNGDVLKASAVLALNYQKRDN